MKKILNKTQLAIMYFLICFCIITGLFTYKKDVKILGPAILDSTVTNQFDLGRGWDRIYPIQLSDEIFDTWNNIEKVQMVDGLK